LGTGILLLRALSVSGVLGKKERKKSSIGHDPLPERLTLWNVSFIIV
jgi:hypothetical protein